MIWHQIARTKKGRKRQVIGLPMIAGRYLVTVDDGCGPYVDFDVYDIDCGWHRHDEHVLAWASVPEPFRADELPDPLWSTLAQLLDVAVKQQDEIKLLRRR